MMTFHFSTCRVVHCIVSMLAGFFVVYSITDPDIWWHLAAGREIVAQRTFLLTDPFSYTAPGTRWIDVHWLFQLLMYAAYSVAGTTGILVVTGAAFATAFWMIAAPFIKNNQAALLLCGFAVIIYLQRYLVPARPIIMTLLAIGVIIASLERYVVSGKRRYLLVCLGMQIVWTNTQGLFLLGPAIAAAYALGETTQRIFKNVQRSTTRKQVLLLALLPPALAAVSLINPYGIHAIVFSLKLFVRIVPSASNIYSSMIDENMPLVSMFGTVYNHYTVIIAAITIALAAAAVVSWKSARLSHYALAAGGLLLAVMAQRNGILFTFLAMPALLHAAGTVSIPAIRHRWIIERIIWSGTIFAVCICVYKHGLLLRSWPHTISPFCHPVTISEYIRKNPLEGRLFNADRYGGYLIWQHYPALLISSDTRLTLRSDRFFREYMNLASEPERFDLHAMRWNITRVALPLAPLSLYHTLAKYLYRHPAWVCVVSDGAEVLFERRAAVGISLNLPETIDSITASLKMRYTSSPSVCNEALVRLARWCLVTESFTGGERVLAQCTGSDAALIRASMRSLQGYYAEAEQILRDEVKKHPRMHFLTLALVNFYLANGHEVQAKKELALLLKKDPFYPPARKLLFRISSKKGS